MQFVWRWLFLIMGWIILLRPKKIRVNFDCGGDFIGIFQDGFNVEVLEVFGLFGERACEFFVTYGMCGNFCYLADLWLSSSILLMKVYLWLLHVWLRSSECWRLLKILIIIVGEVYPVVVHSYRLRRLNSSQVYDFEILWLDRRRLTRLLICNCSLLLSNRIGIKISLTLPNLFCIVNHLHCLTVINGTLGWKLTSFSR